MRLGRPMRLAMEVAAMASVVATTAPRTKPRRQSKPPKMCGAKMATPATVKPTRPKAMKRMLTMLYLKSRYDVNHAAE